MEGKSKHTLKRPRAPTSSPSASDQEQGQGNEPNIALPTSEPENSGVSQDAEGETDPGEPQFASAFVELEDIHGLGAASSPAMPSSSPRPSNSAPIGSHTYQSTLMMIPTGGPPPGGNPSVTAGATGSSPLGHGGASGPHGTLHHIPDASVPFDQSLASGVGSTAAPLPSRGGLYVGPSAGDSIADRVVGTVWDTPAFAAQRGESYNPSGQALNSQDEGLFDDTDLFTDPSRPFRNHTRLRPSNIRVPPPASNPTHARPPPVREPGSLRVPNRRYQNIEGVPAHISPFVGVPIVRHPIDSSDSGFGPAPRQVREADRRRRGVNNWNLAPAALLQRLTHARDALRPADGVHYNSLWSQAPPDFVDIRHLGNVEITAMELLTFFPAHHNWHDYYHRLWENGWERGHVSGYINWARDRLTPDILLANSLSTYVNHMHNDFHTGTNGNPPRCSGTAQNNSPITDYTLQNWTPSPEMLRLDQERMIDYPVIELARGVPLDRLPTGDARRLLTRVVEEVIRTNDHELMLSQVADYVVANGLDSGVTPMPTNADQLAYTRVRRMIVEHRAILARYAKARGHSFN